MLDFELLPEAIEEKWKTLALSQAHYEFLEEDKKTYLSSLMLKTEWSMALREMTARASEDWKTYLAWLRAIREDMLTLKAELASLTAQFDYQRSMNANSRNQRY